MCIFNWHKFYTAKTRKLHINIYIVYIPVTSNRSVGVRGDCEVSAKEKGIQWWYDSNTFITDINK